MVDETMDEDPAAAAQVRLVTENAVLYSPERDNPCHVAARACLVAVLRVARARIHQTAARRRISAAIIAFVGSFIECRES